MIRAGELLAATLRTMRRPVEDWMRLDVA